MSRGKLGVTNRPRPSLPHMDCLTKRQALEQLWRDRLVEAKKRYELACERRRQILGEQQAYLVADGGAASPADPVLRMELEARAEYDDALRAFTYLILHGRKP